MRLSMHTHILKYTLDGGEYLQKFSRIKIVRNNRHQLWSDKGLAHLMKCSKPENWLTGKHTPVTCVPSKATLKNVSTFLDLNLRS